MSIKVSGYKSNAGSTDYFILFCVYDFVFREIENAVRVNWITKESRFGTKY